MENRRLSSSRTRTAATSRSSTRRRYESSARSPSGYRLTTSSQRRRATCSTSVASSIVPTVGQRAPGSLSRSIPSTRQVSWRVAFRGVPNHLAVSPDGDRVYVTVVSGDYVDVFDPARHALIDSVNVGIGPHDIEVSRDGKTVYVGLIRGTDVTVFDAATNRVLRKHSIRSQRSADHALARRDSTLRSTVAVLWLRRRRSTHGKDPSSRRDADAQGREDARYAPGDDESRHPHHRRRAAISSPTAA